MEGEHTVDSEYIHIFNGGVEIVISQDENNNLLIDFTTNYLGYPAVSARLSNWGIDNMTHAAFLTKLADLFNRAAKIVKEQGDE